MISLGSYLNKLWMTRLDCLVFSCSCFFFLAKTGVQLANLGFPGKVTRKLFILLSTDSHARLSKLSPLKRYMKTKEVHTLSSPSAKTLSFAVKGGRANQLAVTQF